MFQTIVVAVDGSPAADRGLMVAAELAAEIKAKLAIVYVVDSNHMEVSEDLLRLAEVEHVVDPMLHNNKIDFRSAPANVIKSLNDAFAESQRRLYQIAEYIVKQASREAIAAGAIQVETKIDVGNPADRIIQFAKAQEADLIVTGKRGFGRIKSLVTGSTSNKISQLAECSCMAVK